MATYHERQLNARERKIKKTLTLLPPYMQEYMSELDSLSAQTRYTYLTDIRSLLEFTQKDSLKSEEFTLKSIPLSSLTDLSSSDIENYLNTLQPKSSSGNTQRGDTKKASDAYKARKLSSIKKFYTFLTKKGYLSHSPLDTISRPDQSASPALTISDQQCQTLLNGVLKNNRFLIEKNSEEGQILSVTEITDEIKARRERQTYRNYLILALILDSGLTVSEIASLNVSSMGEDGITYDRRQGGTGFISYTTRIRNARDLYLNGLSVPEDLKIRQSTPSFEAMWDFCMDNMMKRNLKVAAAQFFGLSDEDFLDDIKEICHYCRMSGRNAFNPKESEKALFLTSKGHRMSIRMIQDMVLEMTRTYLPELTRDKNFTVAALRSAHLESMVTSSPNKEQVLVTDMGLTLHHAKRIRRNVERKGKL